jgi:unsaturated chondroitin disaccharide hydrolase
MQEGKIATSLEASARHAFDFAQEQVRRLITAHPNYFPLYTKDGRWRHEQEAWTNWCEGAPIDAV